MWQTDGGLRRHHRPVPRDVLSLLHDSPPQPSKPLLPFFLKRSPDLGARPHLQFVPLLCLWGPHPLHRHLQPLCSFDQRSSAPWWGVCQRYREADHRRNPTRGRERLKASTRTSDSSIPAFDTCVCTSMYIHRYLIVVVTDIINKHACHRTVASEKKLKDGGHLNVLLPPEDY